jgi:hypothetical protein
MMHPDCCSDEFQGFRFHAGPPKFGLPVLRPRYLSSDGLLIGVYIALVAPCRAI